MRRGNNIIVWKSKVVSFHHGVIVCFYETEWRGVGENEVQIIGVCLLTDGEIAVEVNLRFREGAKMGRLR